jgi:hypothetical protein
VLAKQVPETVSTHRRHLPSSAGRVRRRRCRRPLPSEPDGRRFDASGSSMKQRTAKHAVSLISLEAPCTLPGQSRLPKCLGGGSRTSKDHYGPADISALLPNAGWLSSPVRPHQREVGPLARGVMSPHGSTPIRPITGRPSLAPSSFTRRPIGSPYGPLSLTGRRRAYHVPLMDPDGLGRISSPVVQQLRRVSSEHPSRTTCLFGPSASAACAGHHLRRLTILHLG